mgnify:CR=1 FL=1
MELEATVTTLSDDLTDAEFQRGLLFTEVEIKDVEIKTLNSKVNSSNVEINTLIGKVNFLNVELKSSRLAVTKRKSELRDVKEKLEETEKSNKIEVKKLKKWYKASSREQDVLYVGSFYNDYHDEHGIFSSFIFPLPKSHLYSVRV